MVSNEMALYDGRSWKKKISSSLRGTLGVDGQVGLRDYRAQLEWDDVTFKSGWRMVPVAARREEEEKKNLTRPAEKRLTARPSHKSGEAVYK